MKRIVLLVQVALLSVASLQAQVEDDWSKEVKNSQRDVFQEFKDFERQVKTEFEDFRRQANDEFARFMEEAWKTFNVMEAEDIPWQPKPLVPLEHEGPVTNSLIEYDVVEESPMERMPAYELDPRAGMEANLPAQPEPMQPIVPVFESDVSVQSLVLYGSSFPVKLENMEKERRPKLKNTSERSVARFWRKLSCPYYDNVVAECLKQRKERSLCDWAYVNFTGKMANKYFEPDSNEAVVLQMYLLTQSGYQMRIARADDKLTLLIGSDEKIYRYKYFIMDDVQFYILDRSLQNKSLDVFDHAFPGEKSLSLAVFQPDFNVIKTEKRTLKAKRYPSLSVTVETNRNLIDFYNDYPLSSNWDYYSKASLSNVLKTSLMPVLREAIDGKSELEATDMILDFVQMAFQYKTDEEQFGYERPLYPDETFYYPYSDCEDRSILFSCLVRELLGLDVVLLKYPNHLATAVHFNEQVEGCHLIVDDKVYVICDPTCRYGEVGYCGKDYKNLKPTIVKI